MKRGFFAAAVAVGVATTAVATAGAGIAPRALYAGGQASGSLGSLGGGNAAPSTVTTTPVVSAPPVTVTPTVTAAPTTITAPPVTVTETVTASPTSTTPTVTAPAVTVTAPAVTVTPTETAPTVTVTPTTTVTSTVVSTTTATQTVVPTNPGDGQDGTPGRVGINLLGMSMGMTDHHADQTRNDSYLEVGEDIQWTIILRAGETGQTTGIKTLDFTLTFDPHQTVGAFRDIDTRFCTQTAHEDLGQTQRFSYECGPNGGVSIRGVNSHTAKPGDMVSAQITASATDQSDRTMNWTGSSQFDGNVVVGNINSGGPRTQTLQYPVS